MHFIFALIYIVRSGSIEYMCEEALKKNFVDLKAVAIDPVASSASLTLWLK